MRAGGGNSRKEDSYNYGAAVLKIIMSFEVVLCHYWLFENISDIPVYLRIFNRLRMLAVPTFMIMSFYFLTNSALTKDIRVFKARIGRLLSPYIGWAVIYYIGYLILERIFDIELVGGIQDLICQLLFGNQVYIRQSRRDGAVCLYRDGAFPSQNRAKNIEQQIREDCMRVYIAFPI